MKKNSVLLIMVLIIIPLFICNCLILAGCERDKEIIDAEFMQRVDGLEAGVSGIDDPALKQQVLDNYHSILSMINDDCPYKDINALLIETEEMIMTYIENEIPQTMISEKNLCYEMIAAMPDDVDVKWQVWDILSDTDNAILTRNKTKLQELINQSRNILDTYYDNNISYELCKRIASLKHGIDNEIKYKDDYDQLILIYDQLLKADSSELELLMTNAESLLASKLSEKENFYPKASDIACLRDYINERLDMIMPSYKTQVTRALNSAGGNQIIYENLLNEYKNLDNMLFPNLVPEKSEMYDNLSLTKKKILEKNKFLRDNFTPFYIQAENYYLDNKLPECYEYVLYINKYLDCGKPAPSIFTANKTDLSARVDVIKENIKGLTGVNLTRFTVGIEQADQLMQDKQFKQCDQLLCALEGSLINLGIDLPYYKAVWLKGIDYMAYSPEQYPYSQGWSSTLHSYMNAVYEDETPENIKALDDFIQMMKEGLGEMAGMPQDRNQYWSGYNPNEIYTSDDLTEYLKNIDYTDITNSHYSIDMLPYASLGKASEDAQILTVTMRVSVHLSYYALTGLKLYAEDTSKAATYNSCLNNLKACVNNWIMLQEFAGNGVFPFPDISSVGGNVGNTCKALIAAGIPTKTDSTPLNQGGLGRWIIEDYITDGGLQYDNGLIVGALYHIWEYFKDIDPQFANKCKNAIIWNADTFLLNHNIVKNFNYNSFTVEALAYAYAISGDQRYLDNAIKKFKYGVINGMITEGRMVGRWFDNHNAKMVYQTILVRGSATLLKYCPKTNPYYNTLKEQTAMAYQGVFNEIIAFGSCPDGSYFESLLLEMLNLYPVSFGWTKEYKTTMNIITNAFMQRDSYGTDQFDSCSVYASPLWYFIQNIKAMEK